MSNNKKYNDEGVKQIQAYALTGLTFAFIFALLTSKFVHNILDDKSSQDNDKNNSTVKEATLLNANEIKNNFFILDMNNNGIVDSKDKIIDSSYIEDNGKSVVFLDANNKPIKVLAYSNEKGEYTIVKKPTNYSEGTKQLDNTFENFIKEKTVKTK